MAASRGDADAARRHFDRALALDPGAVEAHLGLADLATDPERARAHLARALQAAPTHPGVLARLAAHTGSAPRPAASLEEALALVEAHPFDPRALLDAGLRLAQADRGAEAVPLLEAVVGLYDRDADAGERAIAALRDVAPGWPERRVVAVQVFVDAPLRERPGWRFRQRMLWQSLSASLDPLLHTRFVPVAFSPFDAAPPEATLEARLRGLVYQTASRSEPALFAGFTAEPTPLRPGARRGVATYLGRHLFVRDAPSEPTGRVLAHELLHVYGGIHVADDMESLMNPEGGSATVDPLNAEIARLIAPRGFEPGGQDANVLERVDLEATSAAFARALEVNLAFRESGLAELLGDASLVGPGAAASARHVIRLDTHLADVSSFAARLFWASGRRVQAVAVLELAAQLYGRQSPKGRAAWTQAEVLRRRLRFELGGAGE